MILGILESIRNNKNSNANLSLDVEIQKGDGSFILLMNPALGSFVQSYSDLQNIVVRLHRKNSQIGKSGAILVNGHFDSVPMVLEYRVS